ncbi:chaperone modulator CbpM [Changchengzhania lutea]|uniref:chaperone modulator CbpM n=1 Tax=Changchengzhania lutea TaxID=2049305 RepID=UPI00115C685D|nr:chaperone modulator CbpM [Changchengzhania lutea]
MEAQDLIPVKLICKRYEVPVSFMSMLQEFQLIELIAEKDNYYIHTTQIKDIEKIIRLHYGLDINLEGVDAICNLLKQVDFLKQEINALHNRLRLYEDY